MPVGEISRCNQSGGALRHAKAAEKLGLRYRTVGF
jgi:hypothetical protein